MTDDAARQEVERRYALAQVIRKARLVPTEDYLIDRILAWQAAQPVVAQPVVAGMSNISGDDTAGDKSGIAQPVVETDEREALRTLIFDRTTAALVDARSLADAVLAAGFRRSQPAPVVVTAEQRRNVARIIARMEWPSSDGRVCDRDRATADAILAALGIEVQP